MIRFAKQLGLLSTVRGLRVFEYLILLTPGTLGTGPGPALGNAHSQLWPHILRTNLITSQNMGRKQLWNHLAGAMEKASLLQRGCECPSLSLTKDTLYLAGSVAFKNLSFQICLGKVQSADGSQNNSSGFIWNDSKNKSGPSFHLNGRAYEKQWEYVIVHKGQHYMRERAQERGWEKEVFSVC